VYEADDVMVASMAWLQQAAVAGYQLQHAAAVGELCHVNVAVATDDLLADDDDDDD